eukprot:3010313-Alexandrium_andersonii.AAC.1
MVSPPYASSRTPRCCVGVRRSTLTTPTWAGSQTMELLLNVAGPNSSSAKWSAPPAGSDFVGRVLLVPGHARG